MTEELNPPSPEDDATLGQVATDYALQEALKQEFAIPEAPFKWTNFKWAEAILNETDEKKLVKIGNLERGETGMPRFQVRFYLNLALVMENEYGDNCPVSVFLRDKASITSTTSLSLKGFLPKLPFSMMKQTRITGDKRETVKSGPLGLSETRTTEGSDDND